MLADENLSGSFIQHEVLFWAEGRMFYFPDTATSYKTKKKQTTNKTPNKPNPKQKNAPPPPKQNQPNNRNESYLQEILF